MSRKNRVPLADRVTRAAEAALAARHSASAIDVLVGIGWLDPGAVGRWRRGQIDCLEAAIQVNAPRIAEAMTLFRAWAIGKGLSASPTAYVARTPQRQTLRFSRSGSPEIEASYRTHWLSPELPEKKRERLAEKAGRAPELVVIQPLNTEWTCHRCGRRGDLLMMEPPGPACLRCVGLDDLVYLPAGDALLTRQAKAKAPDTPSSCASVGAVAATNDRACWSRRNPRQTRNAISTRDDASRRQWVEMSLLRYALGARSSPC
jgi:hypothetical protein